MKLVYKNESSLWTIAAVISGLFWLLLIVATFGLALIYILFGYLFFLFTHSAFIAWLKGTGVRITAEQYPDLHQRLVKHCETLGVAEVPEAYLLRTDFFNAMATRFLGRHFVVLFSDVVDALENRPGAVDFYIGHELGHIHRKHLVWSSFLFPAMFMPLLGSALRRAEEYTCDRYGVACCDSEDDVKAALSAIAAGNSRWSTINLDAYMSQVAETNGFWMSFHELTGDYPWLTKRMATAVALKRGEEVQFPRRHSMAWVLALFVPRLGIPGAGGLSAMIMVIAIMGILAAVAVPKYQSFMEQQRYSSAIEQMDPVRIAVHEYIMANHAYPESLQDLGFTDSQLNGDGYYIELYDYGLVYANMGSDAWGEDVGIIMQPNIDDGTSSTATASGSSENLLADATEYEESAASDDDVYTEEDDEDYSYDEEDSDEDEYAVDLANISSISWSCYGENLNTELLPEACQ